MDFADGGDLCAAVKERAKSGELFEESAVAWLGDGLVELVGWELGDLGFLFHGFLMVGYINTQVLSDQNWGIVHKSTPPEDRFCWKPQSLMGGLDGEEMQISFCFCL